MNLQMDEQNNNEPTNDEQIMMNLRIMNKIIMNLRMMNKIMMNK